MAHYIDADRLKVELIKWRDIQPSTSGLPRKVTYEAMGVIQTIDYVLYLIDSLQQEMWKPSEEQMEALSDAYVEASTFKMGDILESLYNVLQKLL